MDNIYPNQVEIHYYNQPDHKINNPTPYYNTNYQPQPYNYANNRNVFKYKDNKDQSISF